MAYLVRCPVCRYPKRIDAVEDYDLAGCSNALCSVAFLTRAPAWTSPPFTLLYPEGRRLVTYDVYMRHLVDRERAFRGFVLFPFDPAVDEDHTVISKWLHNGKELHHVSTERL